MPDAAIFTEDEVASLNAYQQSGVAHPFTCGNCRADLRAETTGWVCPSCDYRQATALEWMKDWNWLRMAVPGFHCLPEELVRKREELIARDWQPGIDVAEPSDGL